MDETYAEPSIGRYRDRVHAAVLDDLEVGDYGYKYRLLDGVVMPPYITPDRYNMSRTIATRTGGAGGRVIAGRRALCNLLQAYLPGPEWGRLCTHQLL